MLKQMNAMRRNQFFAEAAGDRSNMQGGFRLETSTFNEGLTTNIINITIEATRMLLLPSVDLRDVCAIYDRNMEIVREHLDAPVLTFSQFLRVLSAFKSSWESILISHSTRCLQHEVGPNDVSSPISACLNRYNAYKAGKEDLVTPKRICLHGSLLCMVLSALIKPLEDRANRLESRTKETESLFSNMSTRSNLRAKTKARLETARQSLEDRHRQWQLERDCGWLVNLAGPLQFDYDRLCKSNCFQESLKKGSDLSSMICCIENQRKDLIHRLSSFVLFSSAKSQSWLSSWITEILLDLVLRIDDFGIGS